MYVPRMGRNGLAACCSKRFDALGSVTMTSIVWRRCGMSTELGCRNRPGNTLLSVPVYVLTPPVSGGVFIETLKSFNRRMF